MAKSRFVMKAYSGNVIESWFFGRVIFDIAGMRLNAKLPALREHDRLKAAGVIDTVNKKSSQLIVAGYFLENTTDGREIPALIAEGFPFQSSIGAFPEVVEEVKNKAEVSVNGGTFSGPGIVVRKSHIREISFVVLGADDETSAIAASAVQGKLATAEMKFRQEVKQVLTADPNTPDRELADRALELSKKQSISYPSAVNRVLNEDRQLAARYFKTFHREAE